MNDFSRQVFREQETVRVVSDKREEKDRGVLMKLSDSKTALHLNLLDKITGFEDLFYVFYGSSELPVKADCSLIFRGISYRKLSSRILTTGKNKLAVRTIFERCMK